MEQGSIMETFGIASYLQQSETALCVSLPLTDFRLSGSPQVLHLVTKSSR